MVETPGTAPGSDPLITSAFMSIVPKDTLQIGNWRGRRKGAWEKVRRVVMGNRFVCDFHNIIGIL
ncbi:hypothetical protein AL073_03165 [Loktanella sp. 1ANDIMAR09]|nr:hypothetical protein AL073_03165 [Loktanella sp. 1ANDIMAR09]